jgi:hypothetical protein
MSAMQLMHNGQIPQCIEKQMQSCQIRVYTLHNSHMNMLTEIKLTLQALMVETFCMLCRSKTSMVVDSYLCLWSDGEGLMVEALAVEALVEECLVVDSWVVVLVGMEILVVQEVMMVLVVAKHIPTAGKLEPLLVEVEVEVEVEGA